MATCINLTCLLHLLLFGATILPFAHADTLRSNFRVRAVNLGGWLVTEGWIKPSLFDAIPNKDFLVSSVDHLLIYMIAFTIIICYSHSHSKQLLLSLFDRTELVFSSSL